jgi:hypothetical protein
MFFFIAFLCVLPQSSFAVADLCSAPADCETAIACGISQNFDKITPKYTLDDIVTDAIFGNITDACVNFNFEHGWSNVDIGNGLSIDWKKVKLNVIDKVNYDPSSKNFTFLVTENAWYALGGRATGIIIGSIVVTGVAVCAVFTLGACAAIGAGSAAAAGTAGAAATAATTLGAGTAIAIGTGATAAITAQQISISANKLKVKRTWSDWAGCVNIAEDGKTDVISDLFTTDVVRLAFPDLRDVKFAFNSSNGNLLYKDSVLFTMTAEQKNSILANAAKIADKGDCDWHTWKLYLYPVRLLLKDIDAVGKWDYDVRVESDGVLLDK